MEKQMNKQITLDSFCRGVEDIVELNAKLTGAKASDELKKKLAIWKKGLFRVVVMGECKKGKSSFINALLGVKELSPVDSDVATSTVYKICYGPEIAYRVFFTDLKKEPITIKKEEVANYGTENGNPGNKEDVDFIQVTCPSPLLRAGLVIIDTPGLGGLFKKHKLVTYQYVPKSDAVFLVTDSIGGTIGKLETDLIADLSKVTKHIYFVQTKSKQVDLDAANERKEGNINAIKGLKLDALKFDSNNLYYFVVDSKMKHDADEVKNTKMLERSGFPAVIQFLTQYLQPNVNRLIMERALLECGPIINSTRQAITNKLRNLEATDEATREELITTIKERQNQSNEWEKQVLPDCENELNRRMLNIKEDVAKRCEVCSHQGELYKDIEGELKGASSTAELDSLIEQLNQKLPEYFADVWMSTAQFMKEEMEIALGEFMEVCVQKKDSSISIENVNVPYRRASGGVKREDRGQSFISNAGKLMYGGSIGGTVGGFIGGAVGSIVPGVGNVVGAAVGAKIGAFLGGAAIAISANKQGLEAAKIQVCRQYANWMTAEKATMASDSVRLMDKVMLEIRYRIKKATSEYRDCISLQLKELESAGKKSLAECQQEILGIRNFEKRLNADLTVMGIAV